MGSRVYAPGIGRFLSVDPTPGGNANIYDYCTADPVNCTDLTGNWPDWGAVLNVVAVVAEVVATGVPGPIGTAAGFISAGAYLATGNTSKATEMALVATAQLVGAGLAARAAGQYASKIGRATQKAMSEVARAAVASHGFYGAIMCYSAARGRFNPALRADSYRKALLIPMALHGAYDLGPLILQEVATDEGSPLAILGGLLALVAVVGIVLFEVAWTIRLFRRQRAAQIAPPPLPEIPWTPPVA